MYPLPVPPLYLQVAPDVWSVRQTYQRRHSQYSSLAPTSQVINVPDDGGLPPPSPAKPGPNGEEYYYYYYYYDDEEGQEGPAADYSS